MWIFSNYYDALPVGSVLDDLGRSRLTLTRFLGCWCDIGGYPFVYVYHAFVGVVLSLFFCFWRACIDVFPVGSEYVDLVGRGLPVTHF